MSKQYTARENATFMNRVAVAQSIMGFSMLIGKGMVPKEQKEEPFRMVDESPVYHSGYNSYPSALPSESNLKSWGNFYHPFLMVGMPNCGAKVKVYVNYSDNGYYNIWIRTKLDEWVNGKSDVIQALVAWTPHKKGDTLKKAGFRLFYALVCEMDFIKPDEDCSSNFTDPENWKEEWEASSNCNIVFSALRSTSYSSKSDLEKQIEDAPAFLKESIRKRANIL